MCSFICGISSNGSSGLSSSETVIMLIVPFPLSRRLMPIRRTSRTLKAGSVIGGFRIYSKRQGGLQHCSRLVSVHTTKKALLSISDGRASSFFNTFIKIITPHPFLRAADFRVQRYEEKSGNVEKIGENQRNSEKIGEFKRKSEKNGEKRRNSEKFRENQRKTEKNGEIQRKTEKFRKKQRKSEKNVELSVNFGISVRIIYKFRHICKNYL